MISEQTGGWGRLAFVIGIVLSIVWIGAMFYRGSEQMRVEQLAFADDARKSCEERKGADCAGVWSRAYLEAGDRQRDTPDLLKPGVLEAFGPVLIAWLIAYCVVWAILWVSEGFKLDRDRGGASDDGLDQGDNATTRAAAMIRIIHTAGVTFLIASFGFMVASVVAHNVSGFESWSDGLGATYLWNGALAATLYALLVLLLVGHAVARLIASRRRTQP